MLGMVLFIIFMLIAVILFVKIIYDTESTLKNPIEHIDYKKILLNTLYFALGGAVAFTLAINFIYLWANITPKAYQLVFSIICSFFLYFSLEAFYVSFRLHYWKINLPENIKKLLFKIFAISIPVSILALFYVFNGFAEYLTYPLINGLSFTEGFVYKNGFNGGIAFYAICILFGALLAYGLSDHKMYQQYGKHNTLDSTFLVAFPAGIIGARIWYVIGNWTRDGFDQDFVSIFRIWDGGLTILGGAIMGILVGVLWFMWRNKKLSIWVAVDMIVPTILLAQAIGRLGNFFNVEVHGNPVSTQYFAFLPEIFIRNGMYSSTEATLTAGQMYLPLFLIEGVANVAGYFILSTLFGKLLRKYTELGDLALGYVVFYGLVRLTMEPLRNASYNMGENGYWSWIFSALFVIVGMLGILANHLVRYLLRKKKNTQKASQNWDKSSKIAIICISVVGGLFLVGGILLMAMNKPVLNTLIYNAFNGGVILLTIGIGVLMSLIAPILYLLESKREVALESVNE